LLRLIDRHKVVVVYVGPTKEFVDIKNSGELTRFIDCYASGLKPKIEDRAKTEFQRDIGQLSMF